MKNQVINFSNNFEKYSVFIGVNTINLLKKKIKSLCPKARKIGIIIDKNLPKQHKKKLKDKIKGYEVFFTSFAANEKINLSTKLILF